MVKRLLFYILFINWYIRLSIQYIRERLEVYYFKKVIRVKARQQAYHKVYKLR